jgi:hypothetical protein
MQCWSSEHREWAFGLGLPMMIAYVAGIPLGVYLVLRRHASRLNDADILEKYSFLFSTYRYPDENNKEQLNCAHWEVLVISRKAIFALITVFLASSGTSELQAMAALVVLTVALIAQLQASPFRDSQVNKLELCSIIVSWLTFYLGVFLFIFDTDTEGGWRTAVSILILLLNAAFLLGALSLLLIRFQAYALQTMDKLQACISRWMSSTNHRGSVDQITPPVILNEVELMEFPDVDDDVSEPSSLSQMQLEVNLPMSDQQQVSNNVHPGDVTLPPSIANT